MVYNNIWYSRDIDLLSKIIIMISSCGYIDVGPWSTIFFFFLNSIIWLCRPTRMGHIQPFVRHRSMPWSTTAGIISVPIESSSCKQKESLIPRPWFCGTLEWSQGHFPLGKLMWLSSSWPSMLSFLLSTLVGLGISLRENYRLWRIKIGPATHSSTSTSQLPHHW